MSTVGQLRLLRNTMQWLRMLGVLANLSAGMTPRTPMAGWRLALAGNREGLKGRNGLKRLKGLSGAVAPWRCRQLPDAGGAFSRSFRHAILSTSLCRADARTIQLFEIIHFKNHIDYQLMLVSSGCP